MSAYNAPDRNIPIVNPRKDFITTGSSVAVSNNTSNINNNASDIASLQTSISSLNSQMSGKQNLLNSSPASARLPPEFIGAGGTNEVDFFNATNLMEDLPDTAYNMLTNPSQKLIQAGNGLSYNNNTVPPTLKTDSVPANTIADGSVSNTEFQHLNNVSSNIQTQLDTLSTSITNGLSTKQDTLTSTNRLDASFIGANSGVSNTEYSFLANVSSDIQGQLNNRLSSSSREINGANSEGQVRIRTNSSTSNFESSEGTSLSKFIIRSRYHRNKNNVLINTREKNMFGVFCFSQHDSDGDSCRCDMRGGLFRSNDTQFLSDDRLKWDEQELPSNCLAILKKLKPLQYQKYTEYNVEDPSIRPDGKGKFEFGFIAQDILEIDELKHLVGDDKNYLQPDMPIYALNYNGIYVVAVKAVQEMAEELKDVKNELETIKKRLSDIEIQI